jgi:deoxyribonuclease V
MNIAPLHDWSLTPAEAISLQRELASRVDTRTPLTQCDLVAGVDASYNRFSPILYAAVVVVRLSDGAVVETQTAVGTTEFPYLPGLLTFREAPLVLEACRKLKHRPDVVMVDGQGYAHPRRLGIASHLGLWLDVPTIGCAKSRLIGTYREPKAAATSLSPLLDKDEVIGHVVRTKARTNPVFVSVGHRIDLASAVRVVLRSCKGYRVPEPTRQAHLAVNELRRGFAPV